MASPFFQIALAIAHPCNSVQSSTATNCIQVNIPYVACTSERTKTNLKSYGISTSFKPINTLRGKRVHVKDKQAKDKQSNMVYGLTCAEKECKESYVNETKLFFRARVNQHRRPSSSEAQNSAVYTHINTQATSNSTQRKLLFLTKKNVGLKEVCERQFGREWSSHHLTRKEGYIFSCHMHGTGH